MLDVGEGLPLYLPPITKGPFIKDEKEIENNGKVDHVTVYDPTSEMGDPYHVYGFNEYGSVIPGLAGCVDERRGCCFDRD